MVPSLILFGLVAGLFPRGWVAAVAAVIGWPLLLVVAGVDSGAGFWAAAAIIGAANLAVGFLAGRGVGFLWRRRRVAAQSS